MSRWWPERWRPARALLLAPGVLWDLHDGVRHGGFADWCRAHPGARCRVLVSSVGVVELAVDATLPLHDDSQLLDWARVQLAARDAAATGRACAAWQSGARCGVSVLQGVDLDALQTDAQRHRVQLVAVQPWWSAMLAQASRALPARAAWRLLVVEAARVAVVEAGPSGLAPVETAWLDAADPQALRDWAAAREPATTTLVCGYGLAPGALPGWQCWPGLHDDTPQPAWQARAPA